MCLGETRQVAPVRPCSLDGSDQTRLLLFDLHDRAAQRSSHIIKMSVDRPGSRITNTTTQVRPGLINQQSMDRTNVRSEEDDETPEPELTRSRSTKRIAALTLAVPIKTEFQAPRDARQLTRYSLSCVRATRLLGSYSNVCRMIFRGESIFSHQLKILTDGYCSCFGTEIRS